MNYRLLPPAPLGPSDDECQNLDLKEELLPTSAYVLLTANC